MLAFLGAVFDAPGATARQVLLPDLAERGGLSLERANSVFQSIQNASFLLGPAVAGLLVAAIGPANALWVDAATFLASAILVRALIPAIRPPSDDAAPADVGAGIRTIAQDPVIRLLTVGAIVANFVGTPLFAVVLPVMTTRASLPASALGWLLAAYAAGLLLGSVALGRLPPRIRRSRVVVAGFTAVGLALIVGALGDSLLWLGAWLFVAGLAAGPINPIAFTVIQARIATASHGRVIGAVLGAVLVAAPLGMLVAGVLTARIDARVVVVISGLGFLLVGAWLALSRTTRAVDTVADHGG